MKYLRHSFHELSQILLMAFPELMCQFPNSLVLNCFEMHAVTLQTRITLYEVQANAVLLKLIQTKKDKKTSSHIETNNFRFINF